MLAVPALITPLANCIGSVGDARIIRGIQPESKVCQGCGVCSHGSGCITVFPPGHCVVEVWNGVTHREGEVLSGEGKGGLGHRNLQGYRGCGKGDCICLSISSNGGG